MTPEQSRKLDEMYADFERRKVQQLSYPVDDASRNALGVIADGGAGSATLTQSVAVSGNPENITVPAAFSSSRFVVIGGATLEIPIL